MRTAPSSGTPSWTGEWNGDGLRPIRAGSWRSGWGESYSQRGDGPGSRSDVAVSWTRSEGASEMVAPVPSLSEDLLEFTMRAD